MSTPDTTAVEVNIQEARAWLDHSFGELWHGWSDEAVGAAAAVYSRLIEVLRIAHVNALQGGYEQGDGDRDRVRLALGATSLATGAEGRSGLMATLDELVAQGQRKMRLEHWNEHAYLEVPEDGPWASLYDVGAGVGGGSPIKMLVGEAKMHDPDWLPVRAGQ